MTSLRAITRKRSVRKALVAFLGSALVVLVMVLPDDFPVLSHVQEIAARADRGVWDIVLRVTGGPKERQDIVLLGIDDASLSGTDVDPQVVAGDPILGMMTTRFPWDRSVWAAAIDKLSDAGAKLIVIDLFFSEETFPQSDLDLAEAIGRHRDKVILTSAFSETGVKDGGETLYTLIEPIPELFGPGPDQTRCGFANFKPDDDGKVRAVSYVTTLSEMNGRPHKDSERVYSLAGEILRALGKPVPEGRQEMRLALGRKEGARSIYAPRSVRSIFVPDDWKRNYGEGSFFKDKIVVIGPTAPRFQDQHATIGGVITGPQLHLQALTCALEGAYVRPLDKQHATGTWLLLLLCAVAAAVAWSAWIKRPIVSAVGALGLAVVVLAASYLLAAKAFVLVMVVLVVGTFAAGWILAQSYDLVTERLERGRLHREFRRFVSRDVADTLVRDPDLYRGVASGRRRRVVVLFSDVRGFTSRSEDSDPAELVAQLNEYLSRMVDIVFKHGGTLDKFIGDAVMAHWGALEEGDERDNARAAVEAAGDMLEALDELNGKWMDEGREPFKIGVGLHLGEVLAGEIGSRERTEFGVIGDAVNLASRIEGMTKYFAVPLLVSGAVVDATDGNAKLRCVGSIRVKGRHEPVELHTLSRDPDLDEAFAVALALFQKGEFARAAEAFLELQRADPEDGAASRLAKWSADYAVEPPAGWDGTVVMGSK
ncbi:adenylate/guanylate cyclase domain-containing protein [Luteolibacter ambystomatis]|uniref:Adenylate/guanylate cyclase domain-containing protein n=1 Tax=Luteolibacter ambystomatis TaxID=2824561 RepID=A0A975G657_9BACT|nr:adenylate/guanylate cyclase domain-containing protein [Luteolibacter ambystomatis]QUE49491.1 adenylate/guanylate cyclase domain-containing protein [Luteolibacter ambystomatis]